MDDAERERLEKEVLATLYASRAALMGSHPFLASLAMQLDLVPVWDFRMHTAATDGRKMLHSLRESPGDHKAWNIAMDHEVNDLLISDGLAKPDDAIWFEDCRGMSAEQVYDTLQDPESTRSKERGENADVHPGSDDQDLRDLDQAILEVDPRYGPTTDREAMETWPGRVRTALRQGAGEGLQGRFIEKRLFERTREATVPWRAVLAAFVVRAAGGSAQWLPPARRHVHRGVYLPSRRVDKLRVAVAVDTSGSTTLYQATFVAELAGIISAFRDHELTLIACDEIIGEVQVFSQDNPFDPKAVSLPGGGGTSLCPPFEWLEENGTLPDVMVYLTDGLGDAPARQPPWPMLWVLVPGGQPPAEWGEVVWMPEEAAQGE